MEAIKGTCNMQAKKKHLINVSRQRNVKYAGHQRYMNLGNVSLGFLDDLFIARSLLYSHFLKF